MTAQALLIQRSEMVLRQLKARGIKEQTVLKAMATVPREVFVPEALLSRAYEDGPLRIGKGQTISQPYVVALMIQALELDLRSNVLEIGTGSGYGAAILSRVAGQVTTIERIGHHAARASTRLKELGFDNIEVIDGDGIQGFEKNAPYDGIIATACGGEIPSALKNQMKNGGRLVMPVVDGSYSQRLIKLIRRSESKFDEIDLGPVAFVPLLSGIES